MVIYPKIFKEELLLKIDSKHAIAINQNKIDGKNFHGKNSWGHNWSDIIIPKKFVREKKVKFY